jgi:histidine ammonia-lyase
MWREGLAMINGTQFISSLGAEALVRAQNLVIVADIIGALSLEVLKGTPRAFDPKVLRFKIYLSERTDSCCTSAPWTGGKCTSLAGLVAFG